MDHVQVKPDDDVDFTIKFEGMIGKDFESVAGRERVRTSMEKKAAAQIEEFFKAVTVTPR